MKILITGKNGQLGLTLNQEKPSDLDVFSISRHDLDLCNLQACQNFIEKNRPDWLINTAAYTAVDNAEDDRNNAFLVNSKATEIFARSLSLYGGRFLHVSTDFVFNGKKNTPYLPYDEVDPINVYGSSKALGEKNCLRYSNTIVLRTSWVYSPFKKNFLLTMLRLHKEKALNDEPLKVVVDQIGCPTSTHSLSKICWSIVRKNDSYLNQSRIFHWSQSGIATWYDFAVAIGQIGVEIGLLKKAATVIPIMTSEYSTPAQRPKYSVLDCTSTIDYLDFRPLHWREELINIMTKLFHS